MPENARIYCLAAIIATSLAKVITFQPLPRSKLKDSIRFSLANIIGAIKRGSQVNTTSLLQALRTRIEELAVAIAPLSHQRASQARFDRKLFATHSTQLKDYLLEVRMNMDKLQYSVEQARTDQVAFLAEKLVVQLAALQRELATKELRKSERQLPEAENYYQKLATHQDYERRLQTMINDRESQHAVQTTLIGQQKLQREILALEGRLQRCRQALARLERVIERRERGLG